MKKKMMTMMMMIEVVHMKFTDDQKYTLAGLYIVASGLNTILRIKVLSFSQHSSDWITKTCGRVKDIACKIPFTGKLPDAVCMCFGLGMAAFTNMNNFMIPLF